MSKYVFEVIIHKGNDEFWESNPSDADVTHMLIDALEAYGLMIQRDGGYEFAIDTVTLKKVEG